MTTRLLLVRHAESRHSVDGTVGGPRSDLGLTETGAAQAAALAVRLAGEPIGAVYSSVLPRAVQTAAALGLPVTEDCGLCTWHYPPWSDGRPKSELAARALAGGLFHPFQQDNESWTELVVRTGRAIHTIARRHAGSTTVIVAHSETVTASFHALGGAPLYTPFDLVLDHATITEWSTTSAPAQWPPPRWTLHRLNA